MVTLRTPKPLPGLKYAISTGQATITGYTGSGDAVILPDDINGVPVTSGANAFHSLTSLTILASVTSIGDSAFAGCSSLSLVYFMCNAPSIGSASIPDFTATKGQVHNGSQKI